ncbi:MAG: nuclear transport factor 2 family protein [Betaproteobacteria bacterium]
MPKLETLERFIERVEQNAHVEALNDFYTADSSMQENQSPPRIGREAHMANERRVLAKAKTVVSKCVRPVFVSGDRVVIRWKFRFEWPDETVTQMEELAYQRWEGERVAEETFFYDPVQLVPSKPNT